MCDNILSSPKDIWHCVTAQQHTLVRCRGVVMGEEVEGVGAPQASDVIERHGTRVDGAAAVGVMAAPIRRLAGGQGTSAPDDSLIAAGFLPTRTPKMYTTDCCCLCVFFCDPIVLIVARLACSRAGD